MDGTQDIGGKCKPTQRMIQQAYQRGHERSGHSLEEKLYQTERRIAALMSVFQKKEEDIPTETPT